MLYKLHLRTLSLLYFALIAVRVATFAQVDKGWLLGTVGGFLAGGAGAGGHPGDRHGHSHATLQTDRADVSAKIETDSLQNMPLANNRN